MDKAQKIALTYNEKTIELIGQFKNGQPVGEVTVSCDGASGQVQSPLDGSSAGSSDAAAATEGPEEGYFKLTVVEANLTRDTEVFGKMDPYVKIYTLHKHL